MICGCSIIHNNNKIIRQMIIVLLSYLLLPMAHAVQTFARLELFGNQSMKYYYMSFFVGQPLQPQKLLIDTGSFLTVMACHDCQYCQQNRLQKLYNPELSFSSVKMTCSSRADICKNRCQLKTEYCDFYIDYLDASNVIGRVIDDKMSFQDSTSQSFRGYFGCVKYQKDKTQLASNGLMGLGPMASDSIIYKWFAASPNRQSQFSVCLGLNGGVFQIGKPPNTEQYDAIVRSEEDRMHYSIGDITSITYGKSNLLNNEAYRRYGFILDTGSTLTYFPVQQRKIYVRQLQQTCQRMRKNCILPEQFEGSGCFLYTFSRKTTKQALKMAQLDTKFPTIQVHIDDQTINWYPRNQFYIMEDAEEYGSVVCSGIRSDEKTNSDFYLLGGNFLRQKKVVFNLAEQTISFKDNQTCKYEPLRNPNEKPVFFEAIKQKVVFIATQYGLYIGAALVLIYLAFRKPINAVFNRFISRFSNEVELQEQSVSESVSNQVAQNGSVVTTEVENSKNSNCQIEEGGSKRP